MKHVVDGRLVESRRLHERSIFGGDSSALAEAERQLDGVEADLALARGKVMHGRFLEAIASGGSPPDRMDDELVLLERAGELYESLHDLLGEAEAQFWIGTYHQVVRDDNAVAVPALERACSIATQEGDSLIQSYALRHLGIAEHQAGDLVEARRLLEESTRLRRELGFGEGVAANLVGLAYLAADDGRKGDIAQILDEADVLAGRSDAGGLNRQIKTARAHLIS